MTRRALVSLVMCVAAALIAPAKGVFAYSARRGTHAHSPRAKQCAGTERRCTNGSAAPSATC